MPPRPALRLLPLSLALLLAGCRGDASTGERVIPGSPDGVTFVGGRAVVPAEYAVNGEAVDLAGQLTILANGFPVHQDGVYGMRQAGASLKKRLTPALVSGRNEAAYSVVPFLSRSSAGVAATPVRFTMWVEAPDGSVVPGTARGVAASDSASAAFERGLRARWAGWARAEDSLLAARPGLLRALADSVGSDPHASAYGAGPALDSARAWAARNPVVVRTSFVRSGGAERTPDGQPSFDAVFRDAPVIGGAAADSARLRAYAVRLGALQLARDTAAAFAEFEPAFAARFAVGGGAAAIGMDSTALMARLRDQSIVAGPGEVPVTPAEVGLRSWAGGRVWELYRGAGDPLLDNLRVYVGEVGGALRVVR